MEISFGRPGTAPFRRLTPIPAASVVVEDGFWSPRQRANRTAGLRHAHEQMQLAGNYDNLRIASGEAQGVFRGRPFADSDLYKWLEAIAYELHREEDAALRALAEEAIALIERAQRDDGYLNSYFQSQGLERRWKDLEHGHELYCAGHLIEAALAWRRLLGDSRLFDVALRFVDHIDAHFGPGKVRGVCGHPEIELALVELYRETGERRVLALAQFFIDERGHGLLDPGANNGHNGPSDMQDHVPVRESRSVEGHAVRQLYLCTGVADLYLETGERALFDALCEQWMSMTGAKMYVTGGLGSRHNHEAFSEPFDLPNARAYAETCAAIGSMMWSWRMLIATGEGRYADLIEHTLYNAFLSGVSLDGTRYFYCNPLQSLGVDPLSSRKRIQRMEWPWTPCCPANVMRTLSSLGHWVATTTDEGLQVHQYVGGRIAASLGAAGRVSLTLRTEMPWSGTCSIRIEEAPEREWTLALRVPPWADSVALSVNGVAVPAAASAAGYLELTRRFQPGDRVELELPIEPFLVEASPKLDSATHSVAIQRGPLLYCLEQLDQPRDSDLLATELDERAPLRSVRLDDLLGGIVAVEASGCAVDLSAWGGRLYRRASFDEAAGSGADRLSPTTLRAIPYYAWANRAPTAMRVWIPRRRER